MPTYKIQKYKHWKECHTTGHPQTPTSKYKDKNKQISLRAGINTKGHSTAPKEAPSKNNKGKASKFQGAE